MQVHKVKVRKVKVQQVQLHKVQMYQVQVHQVQVYQVQVYQEHHMHQVQVQQEHHPDNGSNNSEEVEHIEYDSDFKILDWHARDAYQGLRWTWRGGICPYVTTLLQSELLDTHSDKQRRETLSFFSPSFLQFHILKLRVLYE